MDSVDVDLPVTVTVPKQKRVSHRYLPLQLFILQMVCVVVGFCQDQEESLANFSNNTITNQTINGTEPGALTNKTVVTEHEDAEWVRFGSLHMLTNLSRFAQMEENISHVLSERLEFILKEEKLIRAYLNDYKETSMKALVNVPEINDTAERGDFIGSSAVLSHRMITRFATVVSELKELVGSKPYQDIRVQLETALEVDLDLEVELNDETTSNDSVRRSDEIDNQNGTDKPSQANDTAGEAGLNSFSSDNETGSNDYKIRITWPDWTDKYVSSLAFIHMEEVNWIHPAVLRMEKVSNLSDSLVGGELRSPDCFEIGIFALYRGYYYMSVEWLGQAKKTSNSNSFGLELDKINIDFTLISQFLNLAVQENNQMVRYANLTEATLSKGEWLFIKGGIFDPNLDPSDATPEAGLLGGSNLYNYSLNSDHLLNQDYHKFIDLCRGNNFQSLEIQSKLTCYYERDRDPYLWINPVKVERLSEEPPVFQFYDLVGPQEIKRIRELMESLNYLTMSEVMGEGSLESTTRFRTSAGSALYHEDTPKVIKLAEMLTGLELFNSSEFTQYVEYTYGRYYAFHSDTNLIFMKYSETLADQADGLFRGDRYATLLYYLKVPEAGGLTPFTRAGVSGHMVEGSAILWYNMYRNGTVREDVFHGACPVLQGHKIIMNHWVRYGGNFNHRKCSLNQFE